MVLHQPGVGCTLPCSHSYILHNSVLVAGLQGVLQPHPRVLGIFQDDFVCEELLVAVLVRRNKVRNDLCCHIGNVTPFRIFGHKAY